MPGEAPVALKFSEPPPPPSLPHPVIVDQESLKDALMRTIVYQRSVIRWLEEIHRRI